MMSAMLVSYIFIIKNPLFKRKAGFCGTDEARTRDLCLDRAAL
jgi:hypothetical protein